MGESTNYDTPSVQEDKQHQIHAGLILHESAWVSLNGELTALYKRYFSTETSDLLPAINSDDVYEGKNLPEGKKSYAVSFVLQDENKTLADKQIDKIMQKLQQTFEKNLDVDLVC